MWNGYMDNYVYVADRGCRCVPGSGAVVPSAHGFLAPRHLGKGTRHIHNFNLKKGGLAVIKSLRGVS